MAEGNFNFEAIFEFTARQYGVPESTLKDRTLGVVQLNSNPGPKTLLTYDKELKLKHHVEYMAELGYGYARGDFLDISSDYSHF
ncbi:hypothetical protein KUTeg_012330 [Tegillarca granosa]|uniref:Uncharacterized protein n=1 Tax=Tegillarca granosa TaxID=220873 RepID=A0ABQ9F2S0_TEGGR|nr:hypothetical protein KUTeg_012330 [Tegillarca granosa]